MGTLFRSLKETIRSKLAQPAGERGRSQEERTSVGRPSEKEAEHVPPERVGEVVGHSSGG
jgi:hypothetical protein